MNNTKIEWCDSSWNPVTGCFNNCGYCYARKIAVRFGTPQEGENIFDESQPVRDNTEKILPYPHGFCPTLHRYRLDIPQHWKKPRTIFVCSMADLFGDWIPDEWIEEVFSACRKAPRHRYFFLTKYPQRYCKFANYGLLPQSENMWFGTTITSVRDPVFYGKGWNTFMSIEPLLTDFKELKTAFCSMSVRWIIIGAETGTRKGRIIPKKEWVDNILNNADIVKIPVFMKDSLIPIVGEKNMRREFPWGQQYYLSETERKNYYGQ